MRERTPFEEFDRWFSDLTRRSRAGRFNPNTDVFFDSEGRQIVVEVEVAGADAESLSVAVDEEALYITGRRVDRPSRCGSILQKEIEYGEFGTKLHLPAPVDVDVVSACYQDGILTITLPLSPAQEFPAHRTVLRMSVRRIPV
jgi:HSP20 family protein